MYGNKWPVRKGWMLKDVMIGNAVFAALSQKFMCFGSLFWFTPFCCADPKVVKKASDSLGN